jgi:hypothetical protein
MKKKLVIHLGNSEKDWVGIKKTVMFSRSKVKKPPTYEIKKSGYPSLFSQ